jgi:glycosyltransferase involved in cell wall biosynthesis
VVNRVAFAVPGDLSTPTGGYAYDRRIIAELQKLGWQVDVVGLGDGFPKPTWETKAAAKKKLAGLPKGCPIVIDGLAFGVMHEAARELRERNPLIALVHHPLALETGLSPDEAKNFKSSEREALAAARSVVATSPSTAAILVDAYDVDATNITVACPGTDRAQASSGSKDGTLRLLSIGAIVPRKGFDALVAAMADLKSLKWHLTIAGDRTRDPAAAAQLDAEIDRHGLAARIDVLCALPAERIEALYAQSDIFVLASRFEGYGMAYAEALARGLPVVGTTAGAIPDTVPAGAGILVEPNDVKALSRALKMLIANPTERRWLASGARTAAQELPTWRDSAKLVARAIEAAS